MFQIAAIVSTASSSVHQEFTIIAACFSAQDWPSEEGEVEGAIVSGRLCVVPCERY